MRYLTYFTTDNNRIDIHKTFIGVGLVYYNGRLVSRKRGLLGCRHTFQTMENGISVLYEIMIESRLLFHIVGCDIYREGKPLLFS